MTAAFLPSSSILETIAMIQRYFDPTETAAST